MSCNRKKDQRGWIERCVKLKDQRSRNTRVECHVKLKDQGGRIESCVKDRKGRIECDAKDQRGRIVT